jgi:hypothetical protein
MKSVNSPLNLIECSKQIKKKLIKEIDTRKKK